MSQIGATTSKIKVFTRVRPLSSVEVQGGGETSITFPAKNCVHIETNDKCIGKLYSFDGVFGPQATQEEVFNKSTQGIVGDFLKGYNAAILAYGQTSGGKTHTMEGQFGDLENEGITPRIVNEIFNRVDSMDKKNIKIKMSYIEIYLNKIYDILNGKKPNLKIYENNNVSYVKDITERSASNAEEVMQIIEEGRVNRTVGETNLNERSSRSHTVISLNVQQTNDGNIIDSSLYLVDLAGSERVCMSQATGIRLGEAKDINKSLSGLIKVILELKDGNKHISYRNSKLTRILKNSIGGNSHTVVILCCSPASRNKHETKSTLDFGNSAKIIEKFVFSNEKKLTAEDWRRKYEEAVVWIARFANELNKWRNGEKVPLDQQFIITDIMGNGATSITDNKPETSRLLSNAELDVFEEERRNLDAELADKDKQIDEMSQLIDKLLQQEQEEMNNRIQLQHELAEKNHALEKLAINNDRKCQEIKDVNKENESLMEELRSKHSQLSMAQANLEMVKDDCRRKQRRVLGMTTTLLKSLGEKGLALGNSSVELNFSAEVFVPIEEGLKAASRLVKKKRQQLETYKSDSKKKIEILEKEIADGRRLISQYEAKIKSLQASLKDVGIKNRNLEKDLDSDKEKCAKLRAEVKQSLQFAQKMKMDLELEIGKHHDAQAQLWDVRNEIAADNPEVRNRSQYCAQMNKENRQSFKTFSATSTQNSAGSDF